MNADRSFARRARWRWPEIVFWLVAIALWFAPSGKYLILNEIAIFALFALSLDLILGYAGIVSLGHAAFFGLGAYAAGLMCKNVTPDPLLGLGVAMAVAAVLGFATSFLVLRGSDLTRLMVTLGVSLVLHELANSLSRYTGGADGLQGMTVGPLLGRFEFDLYGRTAYAYSLTVLFVLFLLARVVVHSPFGSRMNRAWGLALRKRFCRSFNFELQAAATDNGLNIALAEQHSFPLADVFQFLPAESVQPVLEQAVLAPTLAAHALFARRRVLCTGPEGRPARGRTAGRRTADGDGVDQSVRRSSCTM